MKKRDILTRILLVFLMTAALAACASTPQQSSTGEVVDDSVITTKIKSKIAADDILKAFQISVETRKGVVQLSGFVDSQKSKDKAGEIARSVEGVRSIENDIIVK